MSRTMKRTPIRRQRAEQYGNYISLRMKQEMVAEEAMREQVDREDELILNDEVCSEIDRRSFEVNWKEFI